MLISSCSYTEIYLCLSYHFFSQAAAALKKENGHVIKLKFIKYDQSSQCRSIKDSSVSYAAASLTIM